MRVTQFPDVDDLLTELLARIKNIVGEQLVGLYLYGSLVWGDFNPKASDIDVLVAMSSAIDATVFDRLDSVHGELARKYAYGREDRLEIAYVPLDLLQSFKAQRGHIAIISPGEPFHIKDAGNDWLLNWYFVQEKGIALFGPPPQTIITPISQEEFVHAVQEQAKDWKEWIDHAEHSRPYQAYAILTMCRALYAYKNSEQVSKKHAAVWAQTVLPQWSSLIQNALKWREEWRNNNIDHEATYSETKSFVDFVADQLAE